MPRRCNSMVYPWEEIQAEPYLRDDISTLLQLSTENQDNLAPYCKPLKSRNDERY